MFIVGSDGRALDLDLEFLRDLLRLLDSHLARLEEQAALSPDPDSVGIYDSAEYVVGIGFVACQGYLAATYGPLNVPKPRALEMGPMHRSGYTIAALVNHAANFCKHRWEWPVDVTSPKQARTLAALGELGIQGQDYPLTCALAALVLPTRDRMQALLSHLEAWRDAMAGAA